MPAQWNNSLCVDMSLHLDTLFWFRSNQCCMLSGVVTNTNCTVFDLTWAQTHDLLHSSENANLNTLNSVNLDFDSRTETEIISYINKFHNNPIVYIFFISRLYILFYTFTVFLLYKLTAIALLISPKRLFPRKWTISLILFPYPQFCTFIFPGFF